MVENSKGVLEGRIGARHAGLGVARARGAAGSMACGNEVGGRALKATRGAMLGRCAHEMPRVNLLVVFPGEIVRGR